MEFLFIFLTILHTCFSQFDFGSRNDEALCDDNKLYEISPYRAVSPFPLTWVSATACCQSKGRILHTIERSDESSLFPLAKALINTVGDNPLLSQLWIGVHQHKKSHYQWDFGTDLRYGNRRLTSGNMCMWNDLNTYKWADEYGPNPDPNMYGACVSLRVNQTSEILEFIPEQCGRPLPFICQKIEIRGGSPLRGVDVMSVGSVKFYDIPGFKRLRFANVVARWSVANAICQTGNWDLIDHVHDYYGEDLILEFTKNRNLYMFDPNVDAIQTSGNDFCHPHKWEWICGDHSITIPFHKNCSNSKSEADKLYHHKERCLQYIIPPENNTEGLSPLTAIDVDCNKLGYVVCDTSAACDKDEHYVCLRQEPHFVDVEEGLEMELEKCEEVRFVRRKSTSNLMTYWISTTKFTWKGAEQCCNTRRLSLPSPRTTTELNEIMNDVLANISQICSSGMMCDGFWAGATTIASTKVGPLRFHDGNKTPLPRSLFHWVRADVYSYPSCGRINFMNFEGTYVKYVHAHCLEENFLVCVGPANTERTGRNSGNKEAPFNEVEGREVEVEIMKPRRFDRKLLDKFLEPLVPEEKDLKVWDRNRDSCNDGEILLKYKEKCPHSSSTLHADQKPHNTKTGDQAINAELIVSGQNRILLELLLKTSRINATQEEIESYPYAFQLLTHATTLYTQMCPLISPKFTMKAVETFRRFYLTLYPKPRGEIMKKSDLKWTMKLLQNCVDLAKPSRLMNDICGDLIVAKNCNCSNFICTNPKYESRLYKADILMDIIWKIFEAAYSICFPAFRQNVLLHHKFAMTMIDLWENYDLRVRWSNQIENYKFWTRILGPRFETYVVNMERCNAANIEFSYYKVRLSPSTLPNSARIMGFPYGKL